MSCSACFIRFLLCLICTFSQKGFSVKEHEFQTILLFSSCSVQATSLLQFSFHLPFLYQQEEDETDIKLVPWMITYCICWIGFLTMRNMITTFTFLWFMITKYMLAPLWVNPHIYAHPLAVHVHFKLQTDCKCVFEMPQNTQWRSACTVYSVSHWRQATC